MNWDDLRIFISVAKTSNVTDAGHSLKVSASTVARKIAALEESLGISLFLKKTNGYFLTEAGKNLLPLALETEERFKLIERQISHPNEGAAGRVRIDCPEIMGTHFIIPTLSKVREQYPDISFDVINSAISSKLTQSHSDIIIRLRRPENGNFTMRRLGQLTQCLFCSERYAIKYGIPTEPSELIHHHLIGWTEEMAHMPLAQWLNEISRGQKIWMRLHNLNAQIKAVEADLGIAVLPAYIGQKMGLRHLFPDIPSHRSDIWLLRNQASQDLRRVTVVVDYLIQLFETSRTDIQ
ncbi:LysR family transcriptional regulator [Pseudomonas daroniae]|uniref:LysR family transcriptional regulator n=1 Tax=Phytopseudomonas daroniae TaxID=2487519 RepID=A0A4Q9QGU9_9GAMM|nr:MULTISPECIES: LysR family transcriptional regulator [Pseudomonas]TBU72006.1 LysR family transcriptional regulator [Pseudomonas daroniae]TBU75858.1 LysR family transcriptional regulator [Pseudomonas sp. FRB 228]TBU77357.1 LysR family transcriptional regulator [Pseudomonas daroniae]TBU87134.1 LysR family transcriptional regulator [Pseudomonas daroniae]